MLHSLVYFVLRRLLRTIAPSTGDDLALDIELLVLRHQLRVLSREIQHPSLGRGDRLLLAAGEPGAAARAMEGASGLSRNPPPVH